MQSEPLVIRFTDPSSVPAAGMPAAFLDRDGVLNVDHGFVSNRLDWEWIDGAAEAIAALNRAGYLVVVITNQSGIGRGLYCEDDFRRLMEWVNTELTAHGAHLDAVYACPHHPTEAIGDLCVECVCRKPEPGLLEAAIREWGIDRSASVMIGDVERDLAAARAAHVRALMFETGNLLEFVQANVVGGTER